MSQSSITISDENITKHLVESVLYNPMILKNISNYLTLSDIKSCRLINQKMNQLMFPNLSSRSPILVITTLVLPTEKNFLINYYNLKINPILGKKVRLVLGQKYQESISNQRREFIFSFFQKYHSLIEHLWIECYPKFAPKLVKILNTYKFPNLVSLSIKEIGDENCGKQSCCQENIVIPEILQRPPILSVINFELVWNDNVHTQETVETKRPFHFLIQDLIAKTGENLQKLDIMDNFYPDLTSSTRLKKLGVRLVVHEWDDSEEANYTGDYDDNLDLDLLSVMLDQVKDSLEELSFNDTYHNYCLNHGNLVLPGFPQLKILQVYLMDLDVFPVGRFLSQENHPKLENVDLTIPEYLEEELTLTLRTWTNSPLNSVRILKLKLNKNNVMSLEEIQRAQFIFPNVTSVTLEGQFFSSKLISALCINFKFLEELDVEILAVDLRQKLVSLFKEIIYIEEGLKILKLRFRTAPESIGKFCTFRYEPSELETALFKTKRLTKFIIHGIKLSNPGVEMIKAFAKEHKLPIHFT